MKTLVVLSGGLDSAVALYASELGLGSVALAFDYGQNNVRELNCAKILAKKVGIPLDVVSLRSFGHILAAHMDEGMTKPGSVVTSQPQGSKPPSAYTPARNLVFLSLAVSLAEAMSIQHIVVGFIRGQWTGDAQQDFVNSFTDTANLATECGRAGKKIAVHAPLLHLSKSAVVRMGARLGVPFDHTWSCQNRNDNPCGLCGACIQRWHAFREHGESDPVGPYCHEPKIIHPALLTAYRASHE